MKYRPTRLDLAGPKLQEYVAVFRFGEGQARTQKELAVLWSVSDRDVRLIVSAIRRYAIGPGVLVASRRGYFLTESPRQIRAWLTISERKIRGLNAVLEAVRSQLAELEGRNHG